MTHSENHFIGMDSCAEVNNTYKNVIQFFNGFRIIHCYFDG